MNATPAWLGPRDMDTVYVVEAGDNFEGDSLIMVCGSFGWAVVATEKLYIEHRDHKPYPSLPHYFLVTEMELGSADPGPSWRFAPSQANALEWVWLEKEGGF